MSARPTDLDRRLAALFGTLDVGPAFAARLRAAIARDRPLKDAAAIAAARERVLREHRAAEQALAGRLRASLVWLASVALTAIGPALAGGRLLALAAGGAAPWVAGASAALAVTILAALAARAAPPLRWAA